jgi:mono/diheme cytochrome c family protein
MRRQSGSARVVLYLGKSSRWRGEFRVVLRIKIKNSKSKILMPRRSLLALLACFVVCGGGCQRAVELEYVSTKEQVYVDLSDELQAKIREILRHHCGTPVNPKLLGDESADRFHLRRGAAIFQQRCAACHGVTGDGEGPAAQYLNPHPRDYRRGIFKFTSTLVKARREDLRRTVRHGAKGTSMPGFGLLPDDDIEAVLDYVMALTYRGEFETALAVEASNEDEIADEAVPRLIDEIVDKWKAARGDVVQPLTKEPPYDDASIALGKQAFLTEQAVCHKCHGVDGRGKTSENTQGFVDIWGFKTRAADLTSGKFHGGNRPVDIYRRIFLGIKGTPMPSFQQKFADQPETIWHLVHYIEYVSDARRRDVVAHQLRREGSQSGGEPKKSEDITRPTGETDEE